MDYEAEEDFCWKLLHDLKPASEKQAPVESYTDNNEQKCEHCHSIELIVQEGQYVCRHCNVIQSRVIDDGANGVSMVRKIIVAMIQRDVVCPQTICFQSHRWVQ